MTCPTCHLHPSLIEDGTYEVEPPVESFYRDDARCDLEERIDDGWLERGVSA